MVMHVMVTVVMQMMIPSVLWGCISGRQCSSRSIEIFEAEQRQRYKADL
jgi:hypothetical protein